MSIGDKVELCGTIHPSFGKYRCERFGKCGTQRNHQAVDRSGQGKAQIIEFNDDGDVVDEKQHSGIIENRKVEQGRLF